MLGYVLAVFLLFQLPAEPGQLPEVDAVKLTLAQAETLYYQARFRDSIKLLERVDALLQEKPDRLQERITAKLQLALAYIGLNSNEHAKIFLGQIYEIDPTYSFDPQLIAPKVIELAAAAKAEQSSKQCHAQRSEVVEDLESGNSSTVVGVMEWIKSHCVDLAGMESSIIQILLKKGADSVRNDEYSDALRDFESVLKLSPDNEMAAQYLELVRTKLQLDADRLFREWQKNFEARQYAQAAAAYRSLKDLNEGSNLKMIHHMKTEYRNTLSKLVQAAKEGCEKGDKSKAGAILKEISDMLPEAALGEGILTADAACTAPQ